MQQNTKVAILVRNRSLQRTTQRIVPAEVIASQPFQSWLTEQNLAGADIFIGTNPVHTNSKFRTKEHIREIQHVYLDLDEEAGASLQAIRASGDIPEPNFVLDASPAKHQVVWRGGFLAGPSRRKEATLIPRGDVGPYIRLIDRWILCRS